MTMLPILLAAAMAFPDGKRCAVTYTFDDGLAGRCGNFASPFNAKRGVDGTSVEEAAREAGFSAMRMFQKAAGGAMTAEKMNALVEAARKKGDWLVFMSHGMKRGYDAWESPEELKKHLEWVKAQPDVWVGTFGEVAAYTLEGNDGLP